MNVDETLSRFSDLTYGTSLTVYVLAMVMFLASLATKNKTIEKSDELVAAGVSGGSPLVDADDVRTPGKLQTAEKAPLGDRLAKMAYGVVLLATTLQIASIVLRGVATGRAPWGNMYEFVSITCATGMVAALVVLRKREYRPLLGFVLLPVVILLFIAGTYLYTNAAPVVPALKSYWLAVHVSIVALGSGVFLVSGVASILYLLKLKYPEPSDRFWGRILQRVPSAQTLDRLAYKTVVFAFPLFGLGVICGAIWAEAAWGRFWGWDPKETVSFIAWVIYAAYLHARATAGWRNTAAAWINIAGFVAMLFNLFIINLVVSGLHSYAGL